MNKGILRHPFGYYSTRFIGLFTVIMASFHLKECINYWISLSNPISRCARPFPLTNGKTHSALLVHSVRYEPKRFHREGIPAYSSSLFTAPTEKPRTLDSSELYSAFR